jgi:PadR family transcriptional regulator PadR
MIFKVDATLLEAIVLSVISDRDIYGYKITREMRDIIELSESTLYPVLRRLKKCGLLDSYNVQNLGKNRCYYRITKKGKAQLTLYKKEWLRMLPQSTEF